MRIAAVLRGRSWGEVRRGREGVLREECTLRVQNGAGQLARPDQVKKVRRDIARVHTVLNEKARAGDSA